MFITFITSILYYIYAILLITIFILILIIFLAGLNEITVAAGITIWTNVNVHMYIYTKTPILQPQQDGGFAL